MGTLNSGTQVTVLHICLFLFFVASVFCLPKENTTASPLNNLESECVDLSSWQNPPPLPRLTEDDCKVSITEIWNSVGRKEFQMQRVFLGKNTPQGGGKEHEGASVRLPKVYQGKKCMYYFRKP